MTQDQANLHLVATLRQMDQLILRMSQCQSWEQMRPIFMELLDGTMARMQQESDSIKMLIIPEIRKVYVQPQTKTAAAPGHSRLEGPRDANLDRLPQEMGNTNNDADQGSKRCDEK